VGAAPLWRTGAPTRRPTHPSSLVCPSAATPVRRTRVCLSGGRWPPPGDPLSPPGDLAASCTTGTVTCVAPNAMSTVCPSLPVRSCWCVRGHRPTLALVDGPCRRSRAKSRTLSLQLTVPYIYRNYDTMLTISEHLCVGLMVSL
jgi:hypothetical protein